MKTVFGMEKKKRTVMKMCLGILVFMAVLMLTEKPVSAEYKVLLDMDTVLQEGEPQYFSFSLKKKGTVEFQVWFPERTGFFVDVTGQSGNTVLYEVYGEDSEGWWQCDWEGYIMQLGYYDLSAGRYTITITADADTKMELDASVNYPEPWLISRANVTVGYTYKLKVYDGTVKKWSSNKPSVASVDKHGKVKGRKTGSATILAKLKNGKTLKCKVKVYKNQYSISKPTYVQSGHWGMNVYKAYYKKNGSLVLKVGIVNNMYSQLQMIRNMSITVKNSKGRVVASYYKSERPITVNTGNGTKTITLTIPKKDLYIKKADLRTCYYSHQGCGHTYR